jgi:hypothetical protein
MVYTVNKYRKIVYKFVPYNQTVSYSNMIRGNESLENVAQFTTIICNNKRNSLFVMKSSAERVKKIHVII